MYEKVVNYFERNLCIENIYFRQHYKRWIIGIIGTVALEFLVNFLLGLIFDDLWIWLIITSIIDIIIVGLGLILFYILPIYKLYKERTKGKFNRDVIGVFMKEERIGAYREIEIDEMDRFLRKKCKIKDIESINIILDKIDEEIRDKYEKRSFIKKYFIPIILPVLVCILPIYFTNNNEKNFYVMISKIVMLIITSLVIGNLIFKMKEINIIVPVNKRENLLRLKRVLVDIKIKWNK